MVTLRLFQPDDLSALYAMSLATGHAESDASRLHRDPELVGRIHGLTGTHDLDGPSG